MANLRAAWQRTKLMMIIGAVIGAGVGSFGGYYYFGGWAVAPGLLLGAFLGASLGLDLWLEPLPAAGSRRRQNSPPFTSAIVITLIGLGAVLMGFYAWGPITFSCQRDPADRVDCHRISYAWLGQVPSSDALFPGVYRARQSAPDIVILSTAEYENDLLTDFPPDTGAQITRFLDSREPALLIENHSLWFFPWIFFGIGSVLLFFSRPTFRSAQRKLAAKVEAKRQF